MTGLRRYHRTSVSLVLDHAATLGQREDSHQAERLGSENHVGPEVRVTDRVLASPAQEGGRVVDTSPLA